MRNFYLLAHDPSIFWKHIQDIELGTFDDFPLLVGEELEKAPGEEVKFLLSEKGKFPDYLNNPCSWHIVSTSLKKVFNDEDTVFYSLSNSFFSGREYWLMSLVNPLNCLDKEKSVFEEKDGIITSISKVCLAKERIPFTKKYFLISGCETYLVVNENIKNEINKNNLVGISFISLD
ncbi:MAG: hypothetical protein NE327_06655 [Lentisphaeraceae bacterium]|nr:hypothetical protein [Lentisphaeraceae bacterium]